MSSTTELLSGFSAVLGWWESPGLCDFCSGINIYISIRHENEYWSGSEEQENLSRRKNLHDKDYEVLKI